MSSTIPPDERKLKDYDNPSNKNLDDQKTLPDEIVDKIKQSGTAAEDPSLQQTSNDKYQFFVFGSPGAGKSAVVKELISISEQESGSGSIIWVPLTSEDYSDEAELSSMFSELDEANTRIEKHQAVIQQLKDDTRRSLSELAKVIAKL